MRPDDPPDSVEKVLTRVLADTAIKITRIRPPTLSPASPLRPEVMRPIETLVAKMWPGAAVVPEMSTGATDGLYARNVGIPVYGISAVFDKISDIRAHGRDERVPVQAFHDAVEFWYQLLKTLAGPKTGA
jgi:acetylornithine deacetylase/succinyl-diaminopimelate desuccinylase-like protein